MSSPDAPRTETAQPPLLEARNVSKLYGAVAANDGVSMAVNQGEIHALLGENGAGKSTLVKMIYGVAQPSAGGFFWRGAPYAPRPRRRSRAGGRMVFQHFSLFDALTVLENLALASPPTPMRTLRADVTAVSERYGLAIAPDRRAGALSAGEKQRVEIIRCLLQNPELLILDEPTSVLTPQEADALFAILRRLAAEGRGVLYISHRLDEIRDLCDRATVLRRGRVVAVCDPRQETAESLAEMMVGDGVDWTAVRRALKNDAPVLLRADHLRTPAAAATDTALVDVSFEARAGEILAIAGVAGEGQSELMAALIGERLAPRADMIVINGRPAGRLRPAARRRLGAAFCPEDRDGHAAVSAMRLSENVLLTLRDEGLTVAGVVAPARAAFTAGRICGDFDVRGPAGDPSARMLSGGNLQKFVIGRELSRQPAVLVVAQPTWGVDAGAAAAIRRALIDLADAGAAVLMISQDLEEIFAIADRVCALYRGQLSPAHPIVDVTPERIGLLMTGGETSQTAHTAQEDQQTQEETIA